jgi:3-hydroxybutyryl-CoA dehydrogenase
MVAATVGTVGIVGAGTMGAGIAQLAVEAGHTVLLHDVDAAAIERGRERIRIGLERRASRLELDADSTDDWVAGRMALLTDAPSIEVVGQGCDLVIEAALEDLEAKRAIFRVLDHVATESTLLATNTSALSVGEIAAATTRPARVLGLHFFNPAPLMPLVEVVSGPATEPTAIARAEALVTTWGKQPVRCADTPGFIVNRVNRPFTLEALAIVEAAAATIVSVDAAVRASGFPMGPFELMDLVGIDINLAAARGVYSRSIAAGDPLAERFRPSTIQERLVAAGHLGRKAGLGFYLYENGSRAVTPAPEFDLTEDRSAAMDDAEIVHRIVLAIVNEAYQALGEHVAQRADIDLALRLGAGHPVGPFERVAELGGPSGVVAGLSRFRGNGPRFDPAPALVQEATAG